MDKKETLGPDQPDQLAENIQEDMKEFKVTTDKISRKLQPYQKPILYVCMFLLLLLIFFMGYGLGGNTVCFSHAGVLDRSFHCHIGVLNQTVERGVVDYGGNLFEVNYT